MVNFKIVLINTCIGVICITTRIENNVLIFVKGGIGFESRILFFAVVNKTVNDIREHNLFLFYIQYEGVFFDYFAGFVYNETNVELLLARGTKCAIVELIKLPRTHNRVRQLNA